MNDCVTLEIDSHVARVELNRPEKHNAVSLDMFSALDSVGQELRDHDGVRAVVLSGAGDNFCAGIDTGVFAAKGASIDASAMEPQAPSVANLFQSAAFVWRELPMPVICAIHGAAYGAGLQIALGADIRFASPAARLSVMEIKWGLIPDMAITTTARHIVSVDTLKELSFSGRVISGIEAKELRLVTAVHDDPVNAAERAAEEIAARSPDAIRKMKQLFNTAWELPDSEALALEARLQMGLLGAPNQREAVQANIEQRPPKFAD